MEKLKEKIKKFPKTPGVYLMKSAAGQVIYVGKATSLRDRVTSYFSHPHERRLENLVKEIYDVEHQTTPTVIEALVLEANLIKKYSPKYNVKEKDDKSFLYVAVSQEKFPKIFLIRGLEIKRLTPNDKKQIARLFGPYTSAASLRAALDILRKIFPYRDCQAFPKRPCLQYHLKRCGAPCAGLVPGPDYRKNTKNLILFFEGKKEKILKNLKKEMDAASRKENFELAAKLRNKIFSLEHIQDVAVIKTENSRDQGDRASINIFGRIEGYDISNISGTSATGSMVVFTDGKPNKNEYRKFKIKTVSTPNDVAMMKEIIARRLTHSSKKNNQSLPVTRYPLHVTKIWPLPNLILVDGGWGQINAVKEILSGQKIKIPVLGIAKGFDRKQDRLLYGEENPELGRLAGQNKDILLQVRDEAHRFAIGYHKILRKKKLLNK
jgi:excinuclease ABC subunit C